MMNIQKNLLAAFYLFTFFYMNSALAQNSVLNVEDAYVRGLPPGVQNTSAYMTLINESDEMIMLTGASSSSANTVSIHQTEQANGMMNMTHMKMINIAPHSEVRLETGGTHLMLMGLKSALVAGDKVGITLLFQSGQQQTITLSVRSVLDE